jgi:SSS family solute:Na+ symporter
MVAITAIGIVASRKEARTSSGYFLAGRSLGWPMIGAALFATNISTVHLVGLASAGYSDGLVIGNFEWMAAFCLILLGLVFAPFYFRNRISTLPEFLERRFSPGSRAFLAFMAVVAALFIHIGVSLYAGSKIFVQFFQINIYWSIFIISALTALYTVVGGLKAVVVTEAIQTVLLLLGAVLVTVFALAALPEKGIHSHADFAAALKPGQMNMLHPDGDLSWYAVLLGYPVLGI